MDFRSLDRLVQVGYEAASAQLGEWLSTDDAPATLRRARDCEESPPPQTRQPIVGLR
jgi:hypothetical protein